MRRAAAVDENQGLIVEALRAVGATVYIIGRPVDLLVGYRGVNRLLEVKDGSRPPSERRLTPAQEEFFRSWRGDPPIKVESVGEALRAIWGNR